MKVTLIVVGKSDLGAISALIREYEKRLKHYCKFELLTVKTITKTKGVSVKEILEYESKELQKHLNPKAVLILLDDKDFGNELDFVTIKVFKKTLLNFRPLWATCNKELSLNYVF